MKVLKYGKREITCPRCKSLLEYEEEDIYKQDFCITGGKSGQRKEYIDCPVCKTKIQLDERTTSMTSAFIMKERWKREAREAEKNKN